MRRMSYGLLLLATGWAHAQVPVADFARHAKYRWAEISPSGEYLATTAVVDGKTVLGLVHLASSKGVNLNPRDNDEVTGFDWVAPNRLIYTLGGHYGLGEAPTPTGELFSINGDGSGAATLYGYRAGAPASATHIRRATSDMGYGFLVAASSNEPAFALIGAIPANGPGHAFSFSGAFTEAYRIDLNTGAKQQLLTAPMRGASFLADHGGRIRFAYGIDVDQFAKVFYRGEDGKWETVYDGSKGGARFEPLMFNRTDDSVYARCDGEHGVGGICRWQPKTRQLETIWSARESGSAELIETFDRKDAFAIRTLLGRPAVVLFDKSAPEAQLLVELMKQFPGSDVRFTSGSSDGKKAVFLASGDTDPGTFYLYDAATKKIRPLLARGDWIKPERMATMEPIALKARDGLDLHGYLTRPAGKEQARDLPLVVLPHGGPYGIYDRWGFDPEVQLLASRGYAVLQVNFRGSGGYGLPFQKAGYREWGGKMQDDLTDATRWAVAQHIADRERICIFGTSYGGYAALQGAVKEPDLYRCAIGNAGVYDLRLMYTRGDIPQSEFGENYLKMVLGEDAAELWNRSPIAHLDALKAKVMLIVGGADRRVPPIQAENLHGELAKRKIEHEWLYQRTEGHGFYDEAHTREMYEKVLAFLDRNIGSGYTAVSAK
ncbi:MAG: S9 family peptidase [Proteobacteria bacterium]|nr:S9 family peptidase [Pseudomonadota bacterium]